MKCKDENAVVRLEIVFKQSNFDFLRVRSHI